MFSMSSQRIQHISMQYTSMYVHDLTINLNGHFLISKYLLRYSPPQLWWFHVASGRHKPKLQHMASKKAQRWHRNDGTLLSHMSRILIFQSFHACTIASKADKCWHIVALFCKISALWPVSPLRWNSCVYESQWAWPQDGPSSLQPSRF